MIRANRLSNLIALILAGSLLFPTSALAVSLPYVDDVNEWGANKSILTLYACGKEKAKQFRVTDVKTHKSVKVKNLHRWEKTGYVGTVVVKNGHEYKISVRAKSHGKWGKWKSIGYRVY